MDRQPEAATDTRTVLALAIVLLLVPACGKSSSSPGLKQLDESLLALNREADALLLRTERGLVLDRGGERSPAGRLADCKTEFTPPDSSEFLEPDGSRLYRFGVQIRSAGRKHEGRTARVVASCGFELKAGTAKVLDELFPDSPVFRTPSDHNLRWHRGAKSKLLYLMYDGPTQTFLEVHDGARVVRHSSRRIRRVQLREVAGELLVFGTRSNNGSTDFVRWRGDPRSKDFLDKGEIIVSLPETETVDFVSIDRQGQVAVFVLGVSFTRKAPALRVVDVAKKSVIGKANLRRATRVADVAFSPANDRIAILSMDEESHGRASIHGLDGDQKRRVELSGEPTLIVWRLSGRLLISTADGLFQWGQS